MAVNIVKSLLLMVLLSIASFGYADTLKLGKEVTVNVSPSTVWKMIGNFNHVDVWHPAVVDSKLTDDIRILTLSDGALITEKLLTKTTNSYSYIITDSQLPVKNYHGTISVTLAPEGGSIVAWFSTFDANGVSDEEATDVISGIYSSGLNNLVKHFNQ